MNTIYDVDYFIKKFEAIAENDFGVMKLNDDANGQKCAFGHCGTKKSKTSEHGEGYSWDYQYTEEGLSLINLFATFFSITLWKEQTCIITDINDASCFGKPYFEYSKSSTPKKRILSVLYDIKKLNKEQKVKVSDTTETNTRQMPIIKEIIRYVTISESLKDMAKENLVTETNNS